MTRTGSLRTLAHLPLRALLALALATVACGPSKPNPKDGGSVDGAGSGYDGRDGAGGAGALDDEEENIEPAPQDIEVPPAP